MDGTNEKVIKDKVDLRERIEALIESSDLSYGDVDFALGSLKFAYVEKGDKLLKSINIHKIIETPRFKTRNQQK